MAEAGDGLVVKPDVAAQQQVADQAAAAATPGGSSTATAQPVNAQPESPSGSSGEGSDAGPAASSKPCRFYGTVALDAARVGRDAGRIADEVIAHLTGLVGSSVAVTLEIQAHVPEGVPDTVVRTVTENSRTLKFSAHGFEKE